MGPQHPMTHGLWNMKVKVDGETITDAKPEIGYLHRGYEKIMEVREFQKNVVLTDRLCYVSSITWSHAYCLAVEKMMGIETPERGQWIRVIALELQRAASTSTFVASIPTKRTRRSTSSRKCGTTVGRATRTRGSSAGSTS